MPPQQPSVSVPHRRSFDTISTWALFATLVAALVVFIPSATSSLVATKTFVLVAGTLLTLALYILARLTRGNVILPSSVLLGVLWFPVLAYLLSAAFSGVPFMSAFWGTALESDTLGFMLSATCLGTLSVLLLRRSEHYQSFLRVGAYAFGLIALLQFAIIVLGQFSPSVISPGFSILGSFGDLASFLGLGVVALLITLRFLELKGKARNALMLAGALALFLLAVSNSSLVWVLLGLTSLGLFVESVLQRESKAGDADLDETVVIEEASFETGEGNHSVVAPLAVLAVSLFFLIGGTLGGALASALHVNTLDVRPSWQSTFSVAHEVYAVAPIFGSGPGTFGAEWLKYRDTSLNSTVFWNLDFSSGIGFIPTSFVTTGAIGIIAWVVFLALFIALGLRMLILRAPEDAFIRYVAILSFVGSLYLFAIASFSLPNAVLLALAFVFAGLFISTTRFAAFGRQWGILFSRNPRIGFVIVFSFTILLLSSVVAAYALVGHYLAATQFAKAASALASGDLETADRSAQNSISFAPSAAAYQLQASIARARLGAIAGSSTMERSAAQQAYQAALSAGINAALTATTLAPSNYQSWVILGNLYAEAVPLGVSGAYESAKTAYMKAQELNPTSPQVFYILAQLDMANKDVKSAKENLKSAIMLKQDYTTAIFLLSQLEVQDGNVKEALAAALAAAYFTPNNPNILLQVGILSAAAGNYADAISALGAAVAANSQFANARYFLAAVYAKQGDISSALMQMQAIAALSSENAAAVVSQIAALEVGKNPFPANLLSLPAAPVN